MRKRILILDDDVILLDILHIVLDEDGMDSILVNQTDDLFSLISLHRPSLILLDFYLNGLDGGAWCTQLKNNPEYKNIPVLIFSASSKPITKGSYGCDDFIAKPFDIEDLIRRIKDLINQYNTIFEHSSMTK